MRHGRALRRAVTGGMGGGMVPPQTTALPGAGAEPGMLSTSNGAEDRGPRAAASPWVPGGRGGGAGTSPPGCRHVLQNCTSNICKEFGSCSRLIPATN